jgi:hypothetical protein
MFLAEGRTGVWGLLCSPLSPGLWREWEGDRGPCMAQAVGTLF